MIDIAPDDMPSHRTHGHRRQGRRSLVDRASSGRHPADRRRHGHLSWSEVEFDPMMRIEQSLDPDQIMNPGKLV